MNESESVRLLEGVGLDIPTSVGETMRQAGALDGRLGADCVSRAAREAVAAWAMAVDGDDAALAAIAGQDAVHGLMHPDQGRWEVARGPRVTQIQVSAVEPDGEPPRFRIYFEFVGRREFTDRVQADNPDGDPAFIGLLSLALADAGPWHLESGHVATLDQYLGYVFTSSRETAEGYHRRTGSSLARATASGPLRRYRIIAGFAEHDERFGSRAEVEVQREAAPARYEAVDLVWPSVDEETIRGLGTGDWQPSLLWVDVIELLDGPPAD